MFKLTPLLVQAIRESKWNEPRRFQRAFRRLLQAEVVRAEFEVRSARTGGSPDALLSAQKNLGRARSAQAGFNVGADLSFDDLLRALLPRRIYLEEYRNGLEGLSLLKEQGASNWRRRANLALMLTAILVNSVREVGKRLLRPGTSD